MTCLSTWRHVQEEKKKKKKSVPDVQSETRERAEEVPVYGMNISELVEKMRPVLSQHETSRFPIRFVDLEGYCMCMFLYSMRTRP